MSCDAPSPGTVVLGFLTVVEQPQHGLIGGYLLVNPAGRPLEFHCTAGVRANRAQEILFGPTLKPYLYGEQIGRTLVTKSKLAPVVVLTDLEAVLAARPFVAPPIALVLPPAPAADDEAQPQRRLHAAHAPGDGWATWHFGRNRLACGASHPADREAVAAQLASIGAQLDLSEPFGRIREAIDEAQRGGR